MTIGPAQWGRATERTKPKGSRFMPIRFHCPQCRQMLSIASRKAGSQIDCPRCGLAQTVPGKARTVPGTAAAPASDTPETIEVAPCGPARTRSAPHTSEEDIPSLEDLAPIPSVKGQDESERVAASEPVEPAPVVSAPIAPAVAPEVTPPSITPVAPLAPAVSTTSPPPLPVPVPVERAPRPPSVERREDLPMPSDMILFPRRVFYIQAVLYVVLAVVAFGMGYLIGRGEQRERPIKRQPQTVLVEGMLSYKPDAGRVEGDVGAVVIILPESQYPDKKFAVRGMHPSDPPPADSHETVAAIAKLGGAYTRAETGGRFSVVLPDRGKYRVLLISAHANRPKDSPIDEVEASQINKYFEQAGGLIQKSKYSWELHEVTDRPKPIEYEFGLDGQR
jgi:hypothetical protein